MSGQAGLSASKKILAVFFTNVFLAPELFEMKFELPGRFYAFEWSGKYILPRSSALGRAVPTIIMILQPFSKILSRSIIPITRRDRLDNVSVGHQGW